MFPLTCSQTNLIFYRWYFIHPHSSAGILGPSKDREHLIHTITRIKTLAVEKVNQMLLHTEYNVVLASLITTGRSFNKEP